MGLNTRNIPASPMRELGACARNEESTSSLRSPTLVIPSASRGPAVCPSRSSDSPQFQTPSITSRIHFFTHPHSIAYVLGKEFERSVIGEPDRPGSSAPVKLRGSLCDEQRWYIIRPQSHCGLQVGLAFVRVQTTDSQPRELSNGMKGPSIFVCKASTLATRVFSFARGADALVRAGPLVRLRQQSCHFCGAGRPSVRKCPLSREFRRTRSRASRLFRTLARLPA